MLFRFFVKCNIFVMGSLTKMALMHCDDENDKNYLSNLSVTKKGWGLDTNKGYLSQYLLTPAIPIPFHHHPVSTNITLNSQPLSIQLTIPAFSKVLTKINSSVHQTHTLLVFGANILCPNIFYAASKHKINQTREDAKRRFNL